MRNAVLGLFGFQLLFGSAACVSDAVDASAANGVVEDTSSAQPGAHPTPPPTPAPTPGTTTPGMALSVHTTMGIPEPASTTDPAHVLLVKPQYVTSFDSTRKVPRWTSWELSAKWLGSTSRSPAFAPDPALPSTFPQASNEDYANSGYERGHICPSGDRTDDRADNEATFVFTNAVPQTSASNTGTWETLEVEERALAKAGHHLFIIAGSTFGANPPTIAGGVSVPETMFKIIVVLDTTNSVPADVSTSTRVISVEIPNTTTVSGDYKGYRTSFGALEAKTGFHFLSDVPPSVHDALATKIDAE